MYSYVEDAEPLQLLAIKREKFLKICDRYPLTTEILKDRARERRRRFRKVIFLIYVDK